MKRYGFPILCLLVLLWAATPFWVPHVARWFLMPEPTAEQSASASPKDAVTSAGPQNHAISGQFGEMFGVVNALFSGFALIGVVYGLYLQIEQKRREKQPEVFARLAAKDIERQLVLAPMDATPQGEVHLIMSVPVYITTGSSAAAFNVAISVAYGLLAHETNRLPVPVLSGSDAKDEWEIRLKINATKLAKALPGWRVGQGNERSLGDLEVKIEFENQQQAKWQITAKYSIAVRTPADVALLEGWINNATATRDDARSIELESSAISWIPKEL